MAINAKSLGFAEQAETPAAPSAGNSKVYFKTDGKMYRQNSDGVEIEMASGVEDTTKMPKSGGTFTGTVAFGRNEVQQAKLKDYSEALITNAAAAGAVTLDIANGNVFDITLSGAVTLTFSNPAASGQACSFTLLVRQGTTAYAITWPSSVKWPGDVIPDISAISKTSVLTFLTVNGGNRWYGFLAANGLVT